MPDVKYWAFISYSHKDKTWGDWVHKALETYRVPRRLVGRASRDGKVSRRLFPIFRDREELPTSSDLKSNISSALEQSQYLIVICSPDSAKSRWVNEEIKSFKALGRENRILCLIVDGEPNASDSAAAADKECFPPALRFRVSPDRTLTSERVEPIAADARPSGDGKANAKLKLIAGLIGVSYDELKQREKRRNLWLRLEIAAAAAVVLAIVAGIAQWGARVARQELIAHDIDKGREDLLQGNPGGALESLLNAYSLGGSSPALRFLLHQASLSIPQGILDQHSDGIYMAGFSHDGKRVFTASIDKTANVWDADTGKLLLNLAKHSGEVNSAYFSPDDKMIVTASDDNTAVLWNSQTGKVLHVLQGHKDKVYSAIFDPSGQRIVTASQDSTARIWSVAGDSIATLQLHRRGVLSALFSADGRLVLTAGDDGTAAVWNAADGRLIAQTEPALHGSRLRYADFSPDDKRIVTLARDGEGWLWRFNRSDPVLTRRRDLIAVLSGHLDAGRRVLFSPSGKELVTTSKDGTARVWDGETGKFLFALPVSAKRQWVWSAAFRPDGQVIATVDDAGGVKLWDARYGMLLSSMERHHGSVYGVSFSPDGQRLVSAGDDHLAYVWNVSDPRAVRLVVALDGRASPNTEGRDVTYDAEVLSGSLIRTLPGGDGYVTAAHFSPDARSVLILAGRQAQLWDFRAARRIAVFPVSATDASFDGPGTRVVIGTSDGQIGIWDAAKAAPISSFEAFKGWVFSVQFVPNQSQVVAWGEDQAPNSRSARHRIKFLDLNGREIRPPIDGDDPVLSSDGSHLLSLSPRSSDKFWDAGLHGVVTEPWWSEPPDSDFTVRLWTLDKQGPPLETILRGHSATVYSARFSKDGLRAVTASADKTARIWDVVTGKILAILSGHTGFVKFAAFSPNLVDGRIVTTSKDQSARIWVNYRWQPPALTDRGQDFVRSAVFSPDGALLATLDHDNYVRIWDPATGALLSRLSGHGGEVAVVEFSKDGKWLLTGGQDHTARIWDVGYETRAPAQARTEDEKLIQTASKTSAP